MMTKNILSIDEIKKSVAPICQRYGVKRAYLFGTEINFVDRNEVLKLWHQKMVANNIFWR